jgi:hypothetical protein
MAYLSFASPEPTIDDKPFWEYCAQRELRFQRCTSCKAYRHPPVPACPNCRSFGEEWVWAGEKGRIFSYTIVHHPVFPELADDVPYNIVIVEFPECGGVRLVSNVVDLEPEQILIGREVRLVWEPADNGLLLPRFSGKLA